MDATCKNEKKGNLVLSIELLNDDKVDVDIIIAMPIAQC